jgi:hypothetical protein
MIDPKTSGLKTERRKTLENFMMSKFEQKNDVKERSVEVL